MMLGVNRDVEHILGQIPTDSVGVEIGVGNGDTSARFLTRAKHLHLVDPWSVQAYAEQKDFGGIEGWLTHYETYLGTRDPVQVQAKFDAQYAAVAKRFARNVTIHRCRSKDFFSRFQERVDWVYVDGSHAFENVWGDLNGASLITDCIFGDDFNRANPGVRDAVHLFESKSGWTLTLYGRQQYRLTRC